MKRKKITGRAFVEIDGVNVPWDSLSSEKRTEISTVITKRFLTAFYQAQGCTIKFKDESP